jgi:hypothetical protein
MKPSVILLFTRDRSFDQVVSEAVSEARAVVFIARNVAGALQIICQEHARAVAYANGARTCLSKSLSSARLAATIADVIAPRQQLAAA